jgi:ABC-type Co2+ transport system permease subunit
LGLFLFALLHYFQYICGRWSLTVYCIVTVRRSSALPEALGGLDTAGQCASTSSVRAPHTTHHFTFFLFSIYRLFSRFRLTHLIDLISAMLSGIILASLLLSLATSIVGKPVP